MDDRSYDNNTEPTPVPQSYRPPQPTPRAADTTATQDASLLDRSLFSFSIGGTLEEDFVASLPEFSQEDPPSPLSRPSISLIESRSEGINLQQQSKQQPPVSEVHLGSPSSEEDTLFFECDESLARRTKRSLLASPADTSKKGVKSPLSSYVEQQQQIQHSSQSQTSSSHLGYSPARSHEDVRPSPQQVKQRQRMELSQIDTSTTSKGQLSPRSYGGQMMPAPKERLNASMVSQASTKQTNRSVDPSPEEVVRVHESALQALVRMKEELIKANDKNARLNQENSSLKQERDTFRKQLQDTHLSLEDEHADLKLEKEDWLQEKKDLELQLRTAAREKKNEMHRKLAADNRQKEWRKHLDGIKEELAAAQNEKQALTLDLERVQQTLATVERENEGMKSKLDSQGQADLTKSESLRLKMEQKDQELQKLTNALKETHNKENRLRKKAIEFKKSLEASQDENNKLKMALQDANQALKDNKGSPSKSGRRLVEQHQQEMAVADRLAKMRDSAERAHLIRVHKRELTKLKLEASEQRSSFHKEKEELERNLQKQFNLTLEEKLKHLTKALEQEYEKKAALTEQRDNEKFTELQQELLRSQEDSDEALRAALIKVSEASAEYEQEAARRESVQKSLEKLQADFRVETETQKQHYEQEFQKYRMQWQEERNTLLQQLQKECNTAFETKRQSFAAAAAATVQRHAPSPQRQRRQSISSPTSTLESFFPRELTVNTADFASRSYLAEESAQLISPAQSDIESVLKETEDLIQSIL